MKTKSNHGQIRQIEQPSSQSAIWPTHQAMEELTVVGSVCASRNRASVNSGCADISEYGYFTQERQVNKVTMTFITDFFSEVFGI